jgi:hypothetical protein
MLGGVIYTLADQRLGVLAGSGHVATLPAVLRIPLSQPSFLLGALARLSGRRERGARVALSELSAAETR